MSILQRNARLAPLAAVLTLSLPLPAAAQPVKLRLAHAGSETDSQHIAISEFATRVKERTNGGIEVKVFPGSSLGPDAQAISSTRGGTIDIVLSGSPNFAGMAPQFNALDIPFVFKSNAHAHKVLDGEIGNGLFEQLSQFNLKGLAFMEVGFRMISNGKRPVNRPADVAGLKIRTTPNPMHIKAFQLLGANPVPLALAELYTALESGAVDAQEHPLGIFWSAKLYEVQKHLTLSRHAYTALLAVMNKAKFNSLTPEQQRIIVEEAQAAARRQREINRGDEGRIIAELKGKGIQVVEKVDEKPFYDVVFAGVAKEYTDKNGDSLLSRINAAY
jgi:tripartite ATP-independent transporter DctP family solute receptor